MEYFLVFPYSLSVSSEGSISEFFRVEQKNNSPEPPTVDEVARAIDDITGHDYCNRTIANGGFQPTEEFSPTQKRSEFQSFFSNKLSDPLVAADFAQKMGLEQLCTASRGLPLDIQLFIFWQTEETAESYRLASTADVEFSPPKIIRETLEKEFDVSEVSEKNIEYYIDVRDGIPLYLQVEFEWIGNVVDAEKNIKRGPLNFSLKNNAILSWGEIVSGTFKVTFPTKYHAVTATITPRAGDYSVTVYGVWSGPAVKLPLVVPEKTGEEDCPVKNLLDGIGNLGDVSVTGDDEPEEAAVPEVTCFWRTTHELRQPCGDNELIDRWETIDRVKCPDDIADRTTTVNSPMSLGYIEEIESRYYYELGRRTIPEYISTNDSRFDHDCLECSEEGFKEACCRKPEKNEPIPLCLKIKSTFYGGVEIENGRDYWRDKYPGGVTLQPKLPEDGFCGEQTMRFIAPGTGCCGDIPSLEWVTDNPDIVAPGSSVTIQLVGGSIAQPVTWTLAHGTGFEFGNGRLEITGSRTIEVYATTDACGVVTIIADDGCSEVKLGIAATAGEWEVVYDSIDESNFESVCVVTGIGDDGYYYRQRVTDDWCKNPSIEFCQGSEPQTCDPPSVSNLARVEKRRIEEWGCENV